MMPTRTEPQVFIIGVSACRAGASLATQVALRPGWVGCPVRRARKGPEA